MQSVPVSSTSHTEILQQKHSPTSWWGSVYKFGFRGSTSRVCVCFISSISSAGGQPDAIPFGSIVFFFVRIFFFSGLKQNWKCLTRWLDPFYFHLESLSLFFCCCFRLCVFVRQQIVNTEIEKSALCVCVYLSSVCVCGVYFSSGGERERSGKVTQLRYSGQTAFSCHILPFFSFSFVRKEKKEELMLDAGSDESIRIYFYKSADSLKKKEDCSLLIH